MVLDPYGVGYFIEQVGLSAASFGVAKSDIMQSLQTLKNCLTTAAHIRLLSSRHRDPSTRAFAPTRNARWPWTRLAQLSPPCLNPLLSTKILNEGRKPSGPVYVPAPSDSRPVSNATVQSSSRPAVLLLAHITYLVSFPESLTFSKSGWKLKSNLDVYQCHGEGN